MNLSGVSAESAAGAGENPAVSAPAEEAFTVLLALLVPQARPPDGAGAGGEGSAAPPDRAETAVHATEERAPVPQAESAHTNPRCCGPHHPVRSDGSDAKTRALRVVLQLPQTLPADGAPADGRVGESGPEGGWSDDLSRSHEVLPPEESRSHPPAAVQSGTVGPAVHPGAWPSPVPTGGAGRPHHVPREQPAEPGRAVVGALGRPVWGVDVWSPVPAQGVEGPDRRNVSRLLTGHQVGSSEPDSPQGSSKPVVPPHAVPEGPGPGPVGEAVARTAVPVAVDGAPRVDGAEAEQASLPAPSGVGQARAPAAETVPVAQGVVEDLAARALAAPQTGVTVRPAPDAHSRTGTREHEGVGAHEATWPADPDGRQVADDTVPELEKPHGRRRPASEAGPQVGQVGSGSASRPWAEADPAEQPAPAPQLPREREAAPAPSRLRVELQDAGGEPVRVEVRARSDTVWARVEGSPQVAHAVRAEAQTLHQALQGQGLSLAGLEVDTLPRGRSGAFDEPPAPGPSGRAKPHRRVEEVRVAPGSVDYVV